MHGFIRGLRHLFFITALSVLSTMICSSCSVFRILGLYTVPPPYSDSYEEFHGKPLLHFNKAENISMHLSSDKKSYYPGEPITLICTVKNHSRTDTMGVNSPFTFLWRQIRIINSSGQNVHYHGKQISVLPIFTVDEYGRRLNVSNQKEIPPNSQIEFKRRIDRRYYNNTYKIWSEDKVGKLLERAYDFNIKDLVPDIYALTCIAKHTEFDEIEGPQNGVIYSDTLEIEIMKPTHFQMNQREEYIQIIDCIMELDDIDEIYMRGKTYENNYPNGIFLEKIKKYVLDKQKLKTVLEYLTKYKNGEL